MKVLHVTHRFPPDGIGGVERYVESLSASLAESGHEVAVLTRTPRRWPRRPELVEDPASTAVRVFRIRGAGVRLEQFLVSSVVTEQLIEEVLTHVKPDVVHIHHLIGLSPRIITRAQRMGAAVVLTLHDYYFLCPLVHLTKKSGELCAGPEGGRECAATCFASDLNPLRRWSLRHRYFAHLLSLPECVICPSDDLADRVRATSPSAHVLTAPLGVSLLAPPPAATHETRRPGAFRIAFLGTVSSHKGIEVLLEALGEIVEEVDLLVAGPIVDGAYRRLLERRAAGLRVDWRGAYDREELPTLLDAVDVVVAPSRVPEVFPLAVREALVCGVPVIAARQPGLTDAVLDEVNGLLVDPGDPLALRAAIARVAASPSLLDALGAGARRTAVVSESTHAADLSALYAQVAQGPRTSEGAWAALDELHARAIDAGFAH